MSSHYDVLGVSPNASQDEIRSAYLRRAKFLHPDAHPGATDAMVAELNRAMGALNEAWDVLGDPDSRARYDSSAVTTRARRRPRDPLVLLGPGFYHVGTSRYWKDSKGRRARGLYVGVDTTDLSPLRKLGPHEVLGIEAGGVPIDDAQLVFVGEKLGLRMLNLAETAVTDEGLRHLQPLQALQSLDLGGTAVGDDGLKTLSGIRSLCNLNLSGTAVTDGAVDHLVVLERLTMLLLRYTNVTGEGLRRLEGLRNLRILGLPARVGHRDRRWLRKTFPDAALT